MFNRVGDSAVLLQCFRAISRLGDGLFWYVLMILMLLIARQDHLLIVVHMTSVGLTGVFFYKLIKNRLARERPYIGHKEICCTMPPLDRYSFPSGHTMHAVGFSIVACSYFPVLAWVLLPFAVLVATSRLILGLHYPTDVIAGALLGYGLALLSFEVKSLVY